MATSPEQQTAAMVANMKANTGKTMDQWLKLAARSGESKHGKLVAWLKAEHGLTHGYANLVAHAHLQPEVMAGSGAGADLVAAQYAGAKAGLRPIHDALVAAATALGGDVEVAPKKTCVSLRRSKQFALIQASTRTRVDLGLNLKGEPTTARLEASGSFHAMCTHRVRLEAPADVDAEVKRWLRAAYERA